MQTVIRFGAVLAFAAALLLAGCGRSTAPPIRFGTVTELVPDKEAYYRDLHAHQWPEIRRLLQEAHLRNYTIYEKEIEGHLYLFSYYEYAGTDLKADMDRLSKNPAMKRWWNETNPCQQALPDAAAQGRKWSAMKEIYRLD